MESARVLIVDDNQDAASALAALLRAATNCEVVAACDGRTAVELAKSHRPELILLDLAMPTMDGFAVAESLKRLNLPHLMLVALSGYGDDKMQARCKDAGFDHHELKPIHLERLKELIAEAQASADGSKLPTGRTQETSR